MPATKIVVIGAGSASFGLETISAILASKHLRNSQLALVDKSPQALELMARLAERVNQEWDTQMSITAHSHHDEALAGARFVVSAVEVPPREKLWQSDYEIPLKYGVRQPYAENGGPGGFAHAARNIGPVLEIAHSMEKHCPEAWFINFSNPMIRICDAIHRYSKIKVVGLCHQIYQGFGMVGITLADHLGINIPAGEISTHADPRIWPLMAEVIKQVVPLLDIEAAGLNHFTWMLSLRDKRTGEDLFPRFQERWITHDAAFEPLTRQVFAAFGTFPMSGDEHLCEYLPWVSDPQTKPWEKYEISLYDWDLNDQRRRDGHAQIAQMGTGEASIDHLRAAHGEGVLEIIENITQATPQYHLAVDLPNDGYITNLPEGAIVEVPGVVSGSGIHGMGVGALPEAVAELCRREIAVVQRCVDAAVHGDRAAALQCLLLDPVITDLDTAQAILDDYLETYREYLPQFWQ